VTLARESGSQGENNNRSLSGADFQRSSILVESLEHHDSALLEDGLFQPGRPRNWDRGMSKIVVQCSHTDCREPAAYKIAARWSDGRVAELKTYGFACGEHVGVVFRDAEIRWREYSAGPGESIEELAIYRYEPGKRDRSLQRLWGLEENYRSCGS